jgi:hypothetical protein
MEPEERVMKVSRIAGLAIGAATMTVLLRAQSAEITANYSLLVYNPAKSLTGDRDLNGGGASFVYNFSKHLGLKAEFQGYASTTLTYHLTEIPGIVPSSGKFNTQANMFTYLFGPQFNVFLKRNRLFAETLFGGAYSDAYANLFKTAQVASLSAYKNGFAMALGGGLDVGLGEHTALRVAQFDYFLTRYEWRPLGINNQSNFRYQAGVVFVMGGD